MKNKKKILLEEYKIISEQIMYWDQQYWIKNNFFIVIESTFLTGFFFLVKEYIFLQKTTSLYILLIIFIIIILNIMICKIWEKSAARTKEYIGIRFKRSKKIEKKIKFLKIYRLHDNETYLPRKNSSGEFESWLPRLCSYLWIFILFVFTCVTCGFLNDCCNLLII
ncbi:RipA family octameric membrane protein [Leptospira adleri]|uniref:RipA family octameric membrane protein n=1 Tax=Leptospira adleri TaxID=2023186 RepID=UPI003B8A7FD3